MSSSIAGLSLRISGALAPPSEAIQGSQATHNLTSKPISLKLTLLMQLDGACGSDHMTSLQCLSKTVPLPPFQRYSSLLLSQVPAAETIT